MSAGELSIQAEQLEMQLSQIFRIAYQWNAVLLLDEADVYLEARSLHDLSRNAIVSVILRKLEYLKGIMFLTTNRVSQFDQAILSRIHFMLRYESLNENARKKIWGQFLARATTHYGDADVKDDELKHLVSGKLNGRQVIFPAYSQYPVLLISTRSKMLLPLLAHSPAKTSPMFVSHTSKKLCTPARGLYENFTAKMSPIAFTDSRIERKEGVELRDSGESARLQI